MDFEYQALGLINKLNHSTNQTYLYDNIELYLYPTKYSFREIKIYLIKHTLPHVQQTPFREPLSPQLRKAESFSSKQNSEYKQWSSPCQEHNRDSNNTKRPKQKI